MLLKREFTMGMLSCAIIRLLISSTVPRMLPAGLFISLAAQMSLHQLFCPLDKVARVFPGSAVNSLTKCCHHLRPCDLLSPSKAACLQGCYLCWQKQDGSHQLLPLQCLSCCALPGLFSAVQPFLVQTRPHLL